MTAGSMVVAAEQVGPIHKADKTSALDANFNINAMLIIFQTRGGGGAPGQ